MAELTINSLVIKHNNTTLVDLLQKDTLCSLSINSSLGLVGQSGSGKSLTLKTILHMLPSNLNGEFSYDSSFDMNLQNIGFIPQNPFTSLSPMTKISKQFFQPQELIDHYFDLVGLEKELQNKFPVELSGGQLQRIVIAIALSTNPKLLLLDEPTTALDDLNKQNILQLIKKLQDKLGFITVFVSHDISSIDSVCDHIAVMNKGAICEYGKTDKIIESPQDPYTKLLIESSFENRQFRV